MVDTWRQCVVGVIELLENCYAILRVVALHEGTTYTLDKRRSCNHY
jgi:hypothetical protein